MGIEIAVAYVKCTPILLIFLKKVGMSTLYYPSSNSCHTSFIFSSISSGKVYLMYSAAWYALIFFLLKSFILS